MKQFLLNILKFLPLAAVFYVLMVVFWGEVMPERYQKNLIYNRGTFGHTLSRLTDARNTKNVDVLFLGASTCYRGFDTRYFESKGLTSFNLGSSSQTPINTNLLLKHYLQQIKPKLVVYEVYPETFQIDGVESTLDITANDRLDFYSMQMVFKTLNAKTLNTSIYAYYRQLAGKNTSNRQPKQRETDTYIDHNGFVERELTYFKYLTYKKEVKNGKVVKKKWIIRQKQQAAFEATIALLKAEKIPYLLVRAPITSRLNDSYVNNREFNLYISQFGRYLDFNNSLHLNDSLHFYDAVHLNQRGVKIFNEALYRKLR
ncbi:MAG: hypothetical protein A3D31_06690 [Candidatus Fluviicola riflensis]|nr:MAG: hypothetical protein CHH17_08320 [Candidatus Fluviicola riflensis]OGS79644.1 MAG: hypothetical protein A3D31_06690 [Candidatus Fluviicola riflensis]OGS87076.1 MAG: hypothetical protein A2724_06150 [Fluviicola sp. RIFCSPHIGHO2_01_FULL_43_53]OGS89867.1 MAG: hypothetical protein A3E30_02900 [Fluviicola sp. RIFCSPHIGHO2_12_FULL_43_24]